MRIAVILAWISLSVAVAILAEKKGRSFELFLNLSLVLTPLTGFRSHGKIVQMYNI